MVVSPRITLTPLTSPSAVVHGGAPQDNPDPLSVLVDIGNHLSLSISGPTHYEHNNVLRSERKRKKKEEMTATVEPLFENKGHLLNIYGLNFTN